MKQIGLLLLLLTASVHAWAECPPPPGLGLDSSDLNSGASQDSRLGLSLKDLDWACFGDEAAPLEWAPGSEGARKCAAARRDCREQVDTVVRSSFKHTSSAYSRAMHDPYLGETGPRTPEALMDPPTGPRDTRICDTEDREAIRRARDVVAREEAHHLHVVYVWANWFRWANGHRQVCLAKEKQRWR